MIIHGSYATGTANDESDIDVATYFEPKQLIDFDFREHTKLLGELALAFKVSMEKIDLVVLNTANILLRYEVTSKGKLVCGDADAYAQYCAFAYRDYVDAKPLFDLESIMIRKRHALIQRHVTA